MQRARTGELDHRVVDFLLSDAPYDEKAAAIDAIGWTLAGQDHAGRFARALAVRREVAPSALTPDTLGTAEKFALGFLIAKDHRAHLAPLSGTETGLDGLTASGLLAEVAAALPDVFAVQLVFTMVRAQELAEVSPCDAWRVTEGLLARFPAGRRDVRPAAVRSAVDHMSTYESACAAVDLTARVVPNRPELDDVRAIGRFRGQVVTASAGGVVFWGPYGPVDAREERGCAELLVADGALWVGCQERLLRWDGASWTIELAAADPNGFGVGLGPGGEVRAWAGAAMWARDAQGRMWPSADPGGVDVLWRRDGTACRIDAMGSVWVGDRSFGAGSAGYPGTNPRRLTEGADGRLWVQDDGRGLLVYDDKAGRFGPGGPLKTRGAAMALDAAHDRAWYLHETDGVWLVEGGTSRLIPLRSHQPLHTLWLDEGGEPWIGGKGGLVHLRPVGGVWEPDARTVAGR